VSHSLRRSDRLKRSGPWTGLPDSLIRPQFGLKLVLCNTLASDSDPNGKQRRLFHRVTFSMEYASASFKSPYDIPWETQSQRLSRPVSAHPWHRSGYKRRAKENEWCTKELGISLFHRRPMLLQYGWLWLSVLAHCTKSTCHSFYHSSKPQTCWLHLSWQCCAFHRFLHWICFPFRYFRAKSMEMENWLFP